MTAYLLDTNHASPLVTLHHPLRQRILTALANGDTFAICIPVLAETLFGISIVPRAVENLDVWATLRTSLPCYHIDEHDVSEAVTLQLLLRRRGRQLATSDALIAVIALRYDLTLLTTDNDFQALPALRLANWLAP
jgi:predicted nucleic acid-binding protein